MNTSTITLGTVQFGMKYGIANTAGKPSYETARDIIATAFENGITHFDTAASYGDSEVLLGRVFQELNIQDKVRVVSKIRPYKAKRLSDRGLRQQIAEDVEQSLERLQIDHLAACLFHSEDDLVHIDHLRSLKDRGLILEAGVSLDSATHCEQVLDEGIQVLQLPCNILDRRFEAFWPKAQAARITMFARSVYLQGLLLMPEGQIAQHLQTVIPARRQLEILARENQMYLIELCLRYVLSNTAIHSIVTGVDSVLQLKQNMALFQKGPLPRFLLERIQKVVPLFDETIIRPTLWATI